MQHPECKTKYEVLWKEAKNFLEERLGVAIDDRRHLEVTHLSTALSIRDFKEQVQARCPEGTAVPCEEWLCLQFWPKNPKCKSLIHYLKFSLWYKLGNSEKAILMSIMQLQYLDTCIL